jgi:threonine dehydratase
MALVAGVDGCKGGWVAVMIMHTGAVPSSVSVVPFIQFHDLLHFQPGPAVIAIDIPIGLFDHKQKYGRTCDMEARNLLGPRAVCVFPAPLRSNLGMESFQPGKGISKQTFHIQSKVREVDNVINRDLQRRVYEVHPELSFSKLAGQVMTQKKRKISGLLIALAERPNNRSSAQRFKPQTGAIQR